MKPSIAATLWSVLTLSACATHESEVMPAAPEAHAAADAPADAAKKPDAKPDLAEKETKRATLSRRVKIAERRLDVARMELESWEAAHAGQVAAAEAELELAERKLKQFDEVDSPLRVRQAELNHQRAADSAKEADDELKQIELMYQEQDLNDMTREFVVARGRRNAERRAAQLEIDGANLASLKANTLPQDRRRLELEVLAKRRALEALRRDGAIARVNKEVGIQNAELEADNQRQELAKLEKELAEAGAAAGPDA